MAMAVYLVAVSDKEIELLVKQPAQINKLDNEGVSSYWYTSINFFLCGDAWPEASKKKPLTAMFFGYETIDTATLENGNFGLVRPADVKGIASALAKVNLEKLKKQVEEADADEMADEECDDFELLVTDDEDPGATIVESVTAVRAFYEKAAKLGRGVVMYSS
ncbi:MAG: YfbM family protein [Myxococcota bacterium]|nr:YfbM family protein [Myxococcota bacterium]